MFHRASVKLAGLYLAVMMLISLFFSLNIYQLSMNELDTGLRRPVAGQGHGPERILPRDIREALQIDREQQYQQARTRVINRLLLINALIILAGGALSYYLAERTLKPIEEAHDAQRRFTADASHELRTPITAMRTEVEVALMTPKLTLVQAKHILQSNVEELIKLTTLSEGLLNLAQFESGKITKENVELTELVAGAINQTKALAGQKKILVTTEIAPYSVHANESSLHEALVILLDNAIKYSSEKSEIQVVAKRMAKQVKISVTDHGDGIKASEIPHIFDRFYRADSSRSKSGITGYGIGLAIAKNIVDLHDGRIEVVSLPGKGTTFTIVLPIS